MAGGINYNWLEYCGREFEKKDLAVLLVLNVNPGSFLGAFFIFNCLDRIDAAFYIVKGF